VKNGGGPRSSLLVVAEDDETWMVQSLARLARHRFSCAVRGASEVAAEDASWIASRSIVFVRSRDAAALRALDPIEARGGLVVNRPSAIRRSRHRATALALAAASGVPTASDYEGPAASVPFPRAVVKPRWDDGRSRPVPFERGSAPCSDGIVYAQEFIESAWEHKVYVVGDVLFAFEQRTTMDPAQKRASRRRVPVDASLGTRARRVADAVGLEIAGVDFLVDRGEPKVTDVNSNQGLHTFPEGYPALVDHLSSRRVSRSRG
jgi:ribosomal protein S6--L-glutamate ligase